MDLAYVCEWERWPKSTHCPSVPLACAWSCRNLIAFTTDLRNDDQDLTRMIHILDTEHPWDVHSVNSEHSEAITCLEWDQSGSRLLSADADGQIKCWSMADHLANSWESSVGSLVEGDPIVALSWLHNGVKLALHVEKSGASSFGEKFSRVKFSPSLTLFGGKPMEGWIAVTVSGLVTVSLLKPSGQVLTSTESLCRLRGRVALADIAFTGGGNIVVATADGSSASPVQFYKVCVSVVSEKCRIDTEILPSLFMRCTTDLNRKDKFPAITHLKFLARDMSEQVLLCASSQTSSIVECWSLRKEGLPVNNVFQQISPVVGDKQPMILKWRILSATNDLDRVSAVALPKLPISLTNTDLKVASDTQFYPGLGLALAFHDGSVHIVHRLSLQSMAVFYSSAAPRSADEPAIKRPRTTGPAVHFKAMQLSWTSLALVGIDNHGKGLGLGLEEGGLEEGASCVRSPWRPCPPIPPPPVLTGKPASAFTLRLLTRERIPCSFAPPLGSPGEGPAAWREAFRFWRTGSVSLRRPPRPSSGSAPATQPGDRPVPQKPRAGVVGCGGASEVPPQRRHSACGRPTPWRAGRPGEGVRGPAALPAPSSPAAEHASHLALHGPRAGREPGPAALALPAGVLHGDRLRLVGHPPARAARHGAEPGGEAARGVHAPERGPAAGPVHPDPGHEGLAVQAVALHSGPRVRLPRQALPRGSQLHAQVPPAPTLPQHARQEPWRPADRGLRQDHGRRHRQGHDQPQDGGVRPGHEHAAGAPAAPAVGGRLRALLAGQSAQPGLPAAAGTQLPAGRRLAGHAAGADGRHPDLGPAEAQLLARVHGHLRHPRQHVPALPPAHQALDLLP
ncbi:mediator of RNA polymerase II transcription subunit 16 isoform X1 [Panthera uncia]|uniref:mediator of RNA polymerase II transcription subunit 16 isoform X1 n=1 Tax=Panthera uncia TaxID=29064 RepID=UPI0020FFDFFA|nr:mediator of RNA polymerase II transcription subunit 16 isoform X1 [Panthera uncia]